jgi:GT2 family glycosyltransferase
MTRVAIVIVTYNSASEIGSCLDSLKDLEDVEIVVVDNASADGTRGHVADRKVRLIANDRNAGFAAAVNIGVRQTTAPLVLLLNPDAVLRRGIQALAEEFGDPNIGAAGGLLLDRNGAPQAGFMARSLPGPATLIFEVLGLNRLWPRNPVNWHYRCLGLDPVTPGLVEQPAGAFLMFPRGIWDKLGGFDERFWPVWFEDVDFCARVKKAGLLVRYNPAASAIHAGAHSIDPLSLEIRERYWYGSLLEYAAKHYPTAAFRMVCCAVALGAACRGVTGYARHGTKAVAIHGAVCRLALDRFFSVRAV